MSEQHIRWEEVVEFIEQPKAVAPAVRAHMAKCASCRRAAEDARRLLTLFSDARLPKPPVALVEKTIARILSQVPGSTEACLRAWLDRLGRTFREVRAALIVDSLQPNAVLRGTMAPAAPRTLRYETNDYVVTVAIHPGPDETQWDVMGQAVPRRLPQLPENAWAAVAQEGEMVEAPLSAIGEFHLTGIHPSSQELSILIGDSWIRLRLPLS